jgi:hypothetical protein
MNYPGTTHQLKDRVRDMRRDLITLRYTTDQMKENYKDIYNASHHLFNIIIANKIDMNMLDAMLDKLNSKINAIKPEIADQIDRDMGKVLAEKFLYPTIGKQPELTKEQENVLINKVIAENKKADEKLEKLNSGEITKDQFNENKTRYKI